MKVRGGVLALALLLAVSGCSDEVEPRSLPPVESSSPSPTPLAIPPEAMAQTAEGASAFGRYYFSLVNDALTTGDASRLRDLSDPECGGCRNLIGAAEDEPAAGETVEGGLFEVLFIASPPLAEGGVLTDLRYRVTAVRVTGADGALLREKPSSAPIDAQLRLVRRGSSWVVAGFRNVPR